MIIRATRAWRLRVSLPFPRLVANGAQERKFMNAPTDRGAYSPVTQVMCPSTLSHQGSLTRDPDRGPVLMSTWLPLSTMQGGRIHTTYRCTTTYTNPTRPLAKPFDTSTVAYNTPAHPMCPIQEVMPQQQAPPRSTLSIWTIHKSSSSASDASHSPPAHEQAW